MSDAASSSRATWLVPSGIFAATALLYALLSSLQEVPLVTPDEMTYAHLARSVASGDGLDWYGVAQSVTARLYIYLIAPSWVLAAGESAYGLAKLTGAITVSLVVFPVWVVARRLLPSNLLAAVPVVLTVAGAWMVSAAGLVSENLAFPLGVATLALAVLALREPERRWFWLAFALAALATLTRAQLVVLFPILLLAYGLDVAWAADRRARALLHRTPAIVLGLVVFTSLVVLVAGSTTLLAQYAGVSSFSPPLGRLLSAIGNQWLALALSCAAVPLAALLAVGTSPSSWRDRDIGALLCVTVPATVLLIVESGFFNAGVGGDGLDWSIERYVQYVLPLLFVTLFVAIDRGRLEPARFAIAGALVVATFLLTPDVTQAIEEQVRFAASDLLGSDAWLAAFLIGTATVAVSLVLLRRLPQARHVIGIGAALLLVVIVHSQAFWRWQIDFSQQWRSQFPSSLSWVDDNARGPVSRMFLFQNSPLFNTTDAFNEDIQHDVGPSIAVPGLPAIGPRCSWTASPRGIVLPSEACTPLHRRIWNDDPFLSMSFHGGTFLARDPFLGQLIAVPADPRLRSLIRRPCQRATLAGQDGSPPYFPATACQPNMSINLWLDAPADLALTFGGGRRTQHVTLGTRRWTLPPGRPTVLRIPLNSAAPQLALGLDWTARHGTPKLIGATLTTDGRREPLI